MHNQERRAKESTVRKGVLVIIHQDNNAAYSRASILQFTIVVDPPQTHMILEIIKSMWFKMSNNWKK
jgi:hypothetical protein